MKRRDSGRKGGMARKVKMAGKKATSAFEKGVKSFKKTLNIDGRK